MESVLIVEDNANFADFLKDSIEEIGFKPVIASRPSDANFKLRNQEFKFVLLDLNLEKGQKGESILTLLRSNKSNLNFSVPVLVVSGELDQDRARSLVGSVQGFLVKPFGIEALQEKLASLKLL